MGKWWESFHFPEDFPDFQISQIGSAGWNADVDQNDASPVDAKELSLNLLDPWPGLLKTCIVMQKIFQGWRLKAIEMPRQDLKIKSKVKQEVDDLTN